MIEITRKAYVIAQKIAPKDTYNLVLNGISYNVTENMGEIRYGNVDYIGYLENGTKYYEGAKGFISELTVNEIKSMVYAINNNQFDNNKFEQTRQEVSNYRPTTRTNARYLQHIGGESLVTK